MFGTLLRYEIRYHLTRPITWLYFALFLAGSFAVAATDMIQAVGASGLVMRNAPWVIVRATLLVVTVGQIIVAGLVGSAILRDYQYQTHELIFTTQITRFAYLGGRFVGAFLVMVLVHLGIPLGLMLGTLMPGLDPTKLLPLDLAAYFVPFVTIAVPTILVLSAIFFAVGAFTRSAFAVHAQGIVLLVAWLIAQTLIGSLNDQTLAGLLDPIGTSAYLIATRYWTVIEKNAQVAPSGGLVLANRLLWIAVSLAIAGVTFALFRFRAAPPTLGRRRKRVVDEAPTAALPAFVSVTQRFDRLAWWRQTLSTARMSFWSIVRQVPFAVIVTIGLINLAIAAAYAEAIFGQKVWPVTYTVVEVLNGQFFILFVVLIALYAGDTVWRERELRADQIVDALPAPTSTRVLGSLAGLVLVQVALLVMLAVTGVAFQAASGYFRFELPLYFAFLFGTVLPSLIQLTVFAVAIHVLVNHKYLGHALVILAFVLRSVAPRLGLEHPLFQFAKAAPFRYSDMNGFGPYLPGLFWTALYWTGVAGLIGVVAYLFWGRGAEVPWRARIREAGRRWQGAVRPVAAAFLLVAVGAGGVLFYNANLVNHYQPSAVARSLGAEYERLYKPLARLSEPKLVDVAVRADLEPERSAFRLSGTFTYVNQDSTPIDSVLVSGFAPRELRVDTLSWSRPATLVVEDALHRAWIYRLAEPLVPGDTIALRYHASYQARGFPIAGPDTSVGQFAIRNAISANGSFLNFQYFPFLGYVAWRELASETDRRKEGLPPRVRAAPLEDESARAVTYLGVNADWISFRGTVSTAPDQIAIAPGYLVREYEEAGRRVFEYESREPMLAFFSFLSARYAVRRDRVGEIALEIYYQPGHEFNLDRMMAAMKDGLTEFSSRFSPYQFKQLRIIEFPRYNQFAQAFPNTVPFSENIGFILRAGTSNDDIDTPYYITAHEVAHQWWFHQVVGGNVQGATMLSEALANYSAIVLMEQTFGRNNVRKFLLQQLDSYLAGRGREAKAERPLMLVENQPYIHYNKGSLALYALRDLIGDQAMDRALSRFVSDKAFQRPPFTTSRELIGYLEAETPDSVRYVLDDLFRTITLWDNAVEEASVATLPAGRFEVALRIRAAKARADSLGGEHQVPIADLIDIGVFGEPADGYSLGKPLHLEKHRITTADTTLRIVVDALPRKVGIDPYIKLIDRNPRDNVLDVRPR
ncbi:MAG: M1 family aminopeptidase [Gemmatimonadales bacterium]